MRLLWEDMVMNKFKCGDEVYYFIHHGEGLITDFNDLILYYIKYIYEDEYYLYADQLGLIKGEKIAYFKSKNEAIDALIKRLEELRDNESIMQTLQTK